VVPIGHNAGSAHEAVRPTAQWNVEAPPRQAPQGPLRWTRRQLSRSCCRRRHVAHDPTVGAV